MLTYVTPTVLTLCNYRQKLRMLSHQLLHILWSKSPLPKTTVLIHLNLGPSRFRFVCLDFLFHLLPFRSLLVLRELLFMVVRIKLVVLLRLTLILLAIFLVFEVVIHLLHQIVKLENEILKFFVLLIIDVPRGSRGSAYFINHWNNKLIIIYNFSQNYNNKYPLDISKLIKYSITIIF